MKILRKIIIIFFSVILTLFLLLNILMFRNDISQQELEDTYFTEYSHYQTVEVETLDGQTLSINLHYQEMGEDNTEVVVLIHGAFSSSHTFLPWAEDLVESGYRVIMPDLPFYGLSDYFPDKISSYRRNAEAIKYLLDSLQIEEAHFAGNSLGGATAWYLAGTYPERAVSLNLIDAVYPSEAMTENNFSFLQNSDFLARLVSNYTPRYLLKSILKTAYGDEFFITDELVDRYYYLLRREGTRLAIIQSQFEDLDNLDEVLLNIKNQNIPTLVMWGQLDSWIEVGYADNFQDTLSLSDEAVIIYPTLGHVPMEEDPETTITDYLNFLNSLE